MKKRDQVNNDKREHWRATTPRRNFHPSLFQRLSPAESRDARKLAYNAALAVIG
jgi:hypothetical protein